MKRASGVNEQQESRQLRDLRVFHDVARALTSTLELNNILHSIMDQMAQFFGPETWSLMMVDEAKNELNYAIAVGENADEMRKMHIPMGTGIAGWVAANGSPLIVPDVAKDPRYASFLRDNPGTQLQSIACLPIRSGEKILGVIQLLNYKQDLLQENAISFLYVLCDFAAIAIQNAKSVARIHELSITDDCTGLFNARHLYRLLEEEIARSQVKKKSFSLLFMDLDRFKQVNDTYGHLIGSRLLSEVGTVLRSCLREKDSAFRYGGDEFVVLMPLTDKNTAIQVTECMYRKLKESRFIQDEGLNLQLNASFGLATYPEDGDTMHGIIRSADNMMYEVKNTTRNNIAVAQRGLLYQKPGS
ncbi:MAG: sensor domain-containing diguanylate cyclase [Acidobacteriaceae bacterium]